MKKIKFLPKTILGKWSVFLIIVMPIFLYTGMAFVDYYESISAGKTILEDIIKRPGVALSMLIGFTSGIIAFLIGINSIVKKKDYSISVFLSTIIGFLTLLWCLIQIIFPLIKKF